MYLFVCVDTIVFLPIAENKKHVFLTMPPLWLTRAGQWWWDKFSCT